MKNNSFLVVLIIVLPLLFSLNEDRLIYAKNIKGEAKVVNSNEKTIVILTNTIECSGCESYLNSYLHDKIKSNSTDVIVITHYNTNTVVRRQKYDHFLQVFTVSNTVLFLADNDIICDVKLSSFYSSDFPVILLVNNKEDKCKLYRFNQFASEHKGRLMYSEKFNRDFLEFQE